MDSGHNVCAVSDIEVIDSFIEVKASVIEVKDAVVVMKASTIEVKDAVVVMKGDGMLYVKRTDEGMQM